MQDPLALQPLGELADLIDQAAPGQVGVVGERLAAQRDFLQHLRPFI